ncbi:MAG: hypothetical protein A2151_07885 [Candidatus Muproteobacteria bacterium RBG_16_65_34]|uniref:Segregation and condensation protein A n=1 Tax=Candidatus Muproteobacteria bacterium RBG_16_65_34 TaxID=1817760 RepID=A0A1F6TQH3_9PROT|nr:MAG: hypothetical protein A2151_07885 [Candidatus Muproteobacteria bacterium RBG_16_65_34]
MSEKKASPAETKEYRVLRAMKTVLTDVIQDTTTKPGLKHPLSDRTIEGIRQCLMLIAARERELAEEAGVPTNERPYYADEPPKSVAVPIEDIKRGKKKEE